MTTLMIDLQALKIMDLRMSEDTISMNLNDGRTIAVPILWYPRLLNSTHEERNNWRLIGDGEGIHWPDLDEDISLEGLIAGLPSAESQSSLQRWLSTRKKR